MIDIATWMQNFLQILNETFANRVWFAGLQGSYGRGETIAFKQTVSGIKQSIPKTSQ